jgi:DNA mismatch repair ATPase MutS
MKAFLMHRDQDFDLQRKPLWNEQALTQDLELNMLFNAMALGDEFLFDVAKKTILSDFGNLHTIHYRQNILKDCLKNPSIVRDIYQVTIECVENKKKRWYSIFSRYPGAVLMSSVEMLQMFIGLLKKLKNIADEHADKFGSEGFTAFFAMIRRELDDEYFGILQDHLRELKFRNGVLISAELGEGNEGTHYILRKPNEKKESWMERIFAKRPPVYTFSLHPRDEAGGRFLSELKDRGINLVANALGQSADHVDSFFKMLRIELAFYIGCLNLHESLGQMGGPVCFPLPVAHNERRHSFHGLYDVCLALTMKQKVIGNDVNADNKDLVIITGANQGGKSTFLRSIGLAQLMMQAGMFVPAESFSANVCDRLFTHYKREEDVSMESGKLDEELARMSGIVDNITPNSILLFNESFAATNEREGSEIARQIVSALLEKRVKIFFVTHLYEFSHSLFDKKMKKAIFLRAERGDEGKRTYKLVEGEPLETSYGQDSYIKVFGGEESSPNEQATSFGKSLP